MVPTRCWHCGDPVPIVDSDGNPKPGRTPKTCSDRCRKRMQLRLPNVPRRHSNRTDLDAASFDPRWVPRHPVDEPEVLDHCGCGEPLYRRGQATCAGCHARGSRGALRRREGKEQRRIAMIRAATLENDRIDRCRKCNDDGRRRDGSVCEH